MSRASPTSISERRLRHKLIQEASRVLEKPTSIGLFLKNFNFMVDQRLLQTREPKNRDIFFWKQRLSSFKRIPTDSPFFKARFPQFKTEGHNDMNKNNPSMEKNDLARVMSNLKRKIEVKAYKQREGNQNRQQSADKKVGGWLKQHDFGGGNSRSTKVLLLGI